MAQDKSSNKMDTLRPVPARRNIQSSCDKQSGITYRKTNNKISQSKSEVNVELAKMKNEILQYRKNLRDAQINDPKPIQNRTDTDTTQEMQSLKLQLQDVLKKNSDWQIYDKQREEYVQGLHQKYNDLHIQYHQLQERILQPTKNHDISAEQQRSHFGNLLAKVRKELMESKHENATLKTTNNETKANLESEISLLQQDLKHWKRKYESKKESLFRFHEEYETECHRKASRDTNKENCDQIDILKKDLKTERKRTGEIERRLNNLQNQIKHTEITSSRGNDHLYEYGREEEMERPMHKHSAHSYKQTVSPPKVKKMNPTVDIVHRSHKDRKSYPTERIHGRVRVEKSRKELTNRITDDKPHSSRTSHKLNQTYGGFGNLEDSELQCPNCGKIYGVEEHEFLLVHIDSCV